MKSEIKLLKEYQEYRIGGKSDDPKTVEKKMHVVHTFRKFINKPLYKFNKDDAVQFKNYLLNKRKLGIRTVYSYLYYLEQFFYWLSGEKGYRSKIERNHIEFFSLSRKEKTIVNSGSPKSYPDLEYVLKFLESIPGRVEIGLRDRAMLALAYCTGMRRETLMTLPLGSIDEKFFIYQYPENGVKTKFSKKNITLMFDYHPKLKESVKTWIDLLRKKGFNENDPLFPKFMPIAETEQEVLFPELTGPTKEFLSNPNTLNQIFSRRSKAAGIDYKHPHLYRHAYVASGEEYCDNGRQYKALSQSSSHEHVATTKNIYGELTINELKEELLKINSNILNSHNLSSKDEEFLKMIEELKEKVVSRNRKKKF